MGTKLWGPDVWYVIHVIADSAPDEFTAKDTENYSQFYKSLANVLPCPACSVHFNEFLQSNPPTFKTRMEAMYWTIKAHNHANKHTNKPELTENEALDAIYNAIQARENGTVRGRISTTPEWLYDNGIPFSIGAIVAILILLVFFRNKL